MLQFVFLRCSKEYDPNMDRKKHSRDYYAKKAKQEGFQSRAAYKIDQINQRDKTPVN